MEERKEDTIQGAICSRYMLSAICALALAVSISMGDEWVAWVKTALAGCLMAGFSVSIMLTLRGYFQSKGRPRAEAGYWERGGDTIAMGMVSAALALLGLDMFDGNVLGWLLGAGGFGIAVAFGVYVSELKFALIGAALPIAAVAAYFLIGG